jgi:hypothetical protein
MVILGPLKNLDDVPDMLIAKIRVPKSKPQTNRYLSNQWADIAPIWTWLRSTYSSTDEIIIRNRTILLLKIDIARRQDDLSKIFRSYIEWDVIHNGVQGIYVRIACAKEDKSRELGSRIFIPQYCDPAICTVAAMERYCNITCTVKPLSSEAIAIITGGFWHQPETPLFMWTGKDRNRHLLPATIASVCCKIFESCGFSLQSCQGDPAAHVTRGAAGSHMVSSGALWARVLKHMGVSEANFVKYYWRPLPITFFNGITELTDDAHPCFFLRRCETHKLVLAGSDLIQKGQSGVLDA